VTDLARSLWLPDGIVAAGVGADEQTFRDAVAGTALQLAA